MRAPKYLSGLERALSRTTPERHFPSLIKSLKTAFTKKEPTALRGGDLASDRCTGPHMRVNTTEPRSREWAAAHHAANH